MTRQCPSTAYARSPSNGRSGGPLNRRMGSHRLTVSARWKHRDLNGLFPAENATGERQAASVKCNGGLMTLYNVRAQFGPVGRMLRVYSFTASDDEAAAEFVIGRLTNNPVELWCYSRKIARYEGRPPDVMVAGSLSQNRHD